MKIGNKIRRIADSKGVSAQELGKLVDRSRQGIYDIYSDRVSINVDLAFKISKALDEPIHHFFIDDPDSYYDMIPEVIPMREVLKHMKQVHEHAVRGEAMVHLRIFRTRDGMYIMESVFRELKHELEKDDIDKFERQIDESFSVSS